MEKVVKIQFKENGPSYYFLANLPNLHANVSVLVETERGIQYGQVISDIFEIDTSILKTPLKPIIRFASKKDKQIVRKNEQDAEQALKYARKKSEECNVNISIIDASYTYNRDQLLFHFVADSRVDFRELARSLAAKYRTRIELRQMGVRDKAKQIGGLGSCGQQLCCNRFLKEFDSVSINMAKNQNIALNPTKINGACGRLLCCLKYENETYTEYKKNLPKVGSKVKVEEGEGTVISVDVLNQNYTIDIPKIGQVVKTVHKYGSNK